MTLTRSEDNSFVRMKRDGLAYLINLVMVLGT